MCFVIFCKWPNFIFRLTPRNQNKSLAFSSSVFLPLTGCTRISLRKFSLFAMHGTITKCNTIAVTYVSWENRRLWLVELIGISWGQWGDKSGRYSKYPSSLAGGISRGFAARFWRLRRQNFISRAPTIPPATQASHRPPLAKKTKQYKTRKGIRRRKMNKAPHKNHSQDAHTFTQQPSTATDACYSAAKHNWCDT